VCTTPRKQKITQFALVRAADSRQRQSLQERQSTVSAKVFEHFLETFAGMHASSGGRKISNWLCSPKDSHQNFFIEAELPLESDARNDVAIFSNC